jgi:hypothetical protein
MKAALGNHLEYSTTNSQGQLLQTIEHVFLHAVLSGSNGLKKGIIFPFRYISPTSSLIISCIQNLPRIVNNISEVTSYLEQTTLRKSMPLMFKGIPGKTILNPPVLETKYCN